jgi:hypothetical protein
MKHADRFAEIVCASEETKLRFPKPLRHERKANRIGTADLEHAKKHFDRDAKFRAFVSGHECLLAPWKIAECSGKTEFAHITTGGRSVKGSDYFGVPLCGGHHRTGDGSYHNLGSLEAFDSVHGTNLWRVSAELLAEWVRRIDV